MQKLNQIFMTNPDNDWKIDLRCVPTKYGGVHNEVTQV